MPALSNRANDRRQSRRSVGEPRHCAVPHDVRVRARSPILCARVKCYPTFLGHSGGVRRGGMGTNCRCCKHAGGSGNAWSFKGAVPEQASPSCRWKCLLWVRRWRCGRASKAKLRQAGDTCVMKGAEDGQNADRAGLLCGRAENLPARRMEDQRPAPVGRVGVAGFGLQRLPELGEGHMQTMFGQTRIAAIMSTTLGQSNPHSGLRRVRPIIR